MSVRLTLLALSTLVLSACDGNPLQTAARDACCCDRCPTTAAPAAPAVKPAKATPPAARPPARTVRVRYDRAVVRGEGRYDYRETVSSGYGGRYGASAAAYGATSVQQTASSSSSYSYSESSSGYASGSGSAGGYVVQGGGGPCCAPGGQGGPRGYRSASTDRDGYLTWPGKVED